MRELLLFVIYLVIAIPLMGFIIYVIEWFAARDFGDMKISYRDFRHWLKKDPTRWRVYNNTNVKFYDGKQFWMCYFGFFGLMAYKRYYYSVIFSRGPKKHRLTKAESREKIEQSYEKNKK